jgi:transcriptional regulator with XRE-family HTH domain
MTLSERFSKNLRATRAKRKTSQTALAYESDFSVSYISMLERGERSPPLDTIEALAATLRVKPLALLK